MMLVTKQEDKSDHYLGEPGPASNRAVGLTTLHLFIACVEAQATNAN